MKTLGYVLIHKDLLTELLENTIECFNIHEVRHVSPRSKGVLARYQSEIDQVRKLLTSTIRSNE